MRRLVVCICVLVFVGPAPAAAPPAPVPAGVFDLGFLIREPVVVKKLLPFRWPAKGAITGVYGNDAGRRHAGIDIGILRSLTVRAAAPGRVKKAGYIRGYEGYGKVVIVRSGKFEVLYAHLSHVNAKPGQLVERGKRLGVAGCTGWCTGTHLHFEVRKGERTVNPMRLLSSARS